MTINDLTLEDIGKIIEIEDKPKAYIPEQTSRYTRRYDREMTCTSRRCGSPTYWKVLGMPLCQIHVIHKLTELLDAKDERERRDKGEIESTTT